MHMSLTWVLVAASWIHVAELSLAQDASAPEPSPTSAAAMPGPIASPGNLGAWPVRNLAGDRVNKLHSGAIA